MITLPSFSKELDKTFTGEVVEGPVENPVACHWVAAFKLTDQEYANSIGDLWSGYIQPALKSLADKLNKEGQKGRTKQLPLPPKDKVVWAAISADGKLPLRFVLVHRANESESWYMFLIDTIYEKAE